MPTDALDIGDVTAMLAKSAHDLWAAAGELNALDAQIGDGDLGTSVATLFETAISELTEPSSSAGRYLKDFGDSLMRLCSGASGTLYAALFTALGDELEANETITVGQLALGFRRGVETVKRLGGASTGDATMIDAIEPFVQALEEHVDEDIDLTSVLGLAADAAARGAASTTDLVARLGRAKGFGDRTLGHVDPGARSFEVITNAWRE